MSFDDGEAIIEGHPQVRHLSGLARRTQAQLGSGMRILEIGSGGCNAGLIAELVDQRGEVTTIDSTLG